MGKDAVPLSFTSAALIGAIGCSAAAACTDRADIAEYFFKKAFVTAERWRFVAFGANFGDQFFAGFRNGRDIACGIETDLEDKLFRGRWLSKGELTCIAGVIIPIICVKLPHKSRAAKRCLHRFLVIDTRLHRRQQSLVSNIPLMRAQTCAARGDCQYGNKGTQNYDLRLAHKLLRYCTKLRLCHCILGPQYQYAMPDECRMSGTEQGRMTFWKKIFGPAQADPKQHLVPLYTQIVAKARQSHWYEIGHVPDSIDGRFDMIAAIFSLVLLRLEQDAAQGSNMAHLTEVLVDDMDGQLREVGIGDMIVGKHIGKIMGAIGGRITALREALADKNRLDDAITRNIYRGAVVDASAMAHIRDSLVDIEQSLLLVTPDDLATGNASW